MRVLMLEDNPSDMELQARELRKLGLSVITANDAEQALATAKHEQPDLIVSDLKLIGMDGYAFARACKATAETKHIPIIAITGATTLAEESMAFAAGFDDFLTKPIRPDVMAEMVNKLLVEREKRNSLLFRMEVRRNYDNLSARVATLETGQMGLHAGQRDQSEEIAKLSRGVEEARGIFLREMHNILADNQRKWQTVGELLEQFRKSQHLQSLGVFVLFLAVAALIIAMGTR